MEEREVEYNRSRTMEDTELVQSTKGYSRDPHRKGIQKRSERVRKGKNVL